MERKEKRTMEFHPVLNGKPLMTKRLVITSPQQPQFPSLGGYHQSLCHLTYLTAQIMMRWNILYHYTRSLKTQVQDAHRHLYLNLTKKRMKILQVSQTIRNFCFYFLNPIIE